MQGAVTSPPPKNQYGEWEKTEGNKIERKLSKWPEHSLQIGQTNGFLGVTPLTQIPPQNNSNDNEN